jgi:chaperonin GroEL
LESSFFLAQATETVVQYLNETSVHITTSEEIAQVATISANGDKHVGTRGHSF